MSNDLFFIPLLARAIGEPDTASALQNAFAEIQRLGKREEYRRGFSQFARFMEQVARDAQSSALEIRVWRNDRQVGTVTITHSKRSGGLVGIASGEHSLSLSTGRVIWQGEIVPKDILWALAFPGRPLEVAAATEPTQPEATRTESLLGGELILRVFPGLESGRLAVELGHSGAL